MCGCTGVPAYGCSIGAQAVAYLGFHFGGGVQNIFGKVGAFACREACTILKNGAIWCVLEHIFRELSLKKIYINLNNIDMLLLRTSYRYGVFLK